MFGKKIEWFLLLISATVTIVVVLSLVRWFAPQLLGIPVDLQMVRVSKEVPPFFDNVFRPEDYKSESYILTDPHITRAQPLWRRFYDSGPNDLLGFRNRNIPVFADIITIGDSQTYGNNVFLEQNWPSSMVAAIENNEPVLYNMSVGGWGAAEYFEIFNKALYLQPRVVIIAFYTGNDPLDTFIKVYGDERWKSMRLDPDISASKAPKISEQLEWKVQFKDGVQTIFVPNYRYISNMSHPAVRAGYEIMGKIAANIVSISQKVHVRTVFTIIPTKELAFKKKVARENITPREDYSALLDNEERNIEKLAQVLQSIPGAVYIDVVKPLQEEVLKSGKVYPSGKDGHPLAEGYQVIGNTLSGTIESLLPERLSGAIKAQVSLEKSELFLVMENQLWTFSSGEIVAKNGWTKDQFKMVRLRDVCTIPYGGEISTIDPSRYGPEAFERN